MNETEKQKILEEAWKRATKEADQRTGIRKPLPQRLIITTKDGKFFGYYELVETQKGGVD